MTTEEKLKILAEAILALNSHTRFISEHDNEYEALTSDLSQQIWEIANDSSV